MLCSPWWVHGSVSICLFLPLPPVLAALCPPTARLHTLCALAQPCSPAQLQFDSEQYKLLYFWCSRKWWRLTHRWQWLSQLFLHRARVKSDVGGEGALTVGAQNFLFLCMCNPWLLQNWRPPVRRAQAARRSCQQVSSCGTRNPLSPS